MSTTTVIPSTASPHFSAMSSLQSPLMLASARASFLSPLLGLRHSLKLKSITPHRKQNFAVRASRTKSTGVSLGFRAPDFQLPEPSTGKIWKLQEFEVYPALLVMFICNHCPFVIHLKKDIVKLSNYYMKKGLAVVAISSNSVVTHPQDGPESMAEEAKAYGYPFPYLYDESQDVARDFRAVCTPEFFLFKKAGRRPFELVYHGQFDDSRPSNNMPITGRDLSRAIDAVLSGQPVPSVQKPRFLSSTIYHTCFSLKIIFLSFKIYCTNICWVVLDVALSGIPTRNNDLIGPLSSNSEMILATITYGSAFRLTP